MTEENARNDGVASFRLLIAARGLPLGFGHVRLHALPEVQCRERRRQALEPTLEEQGARNLTAESGHFASQPAVGGSSVPKREADLRQELLERLQMAHENYRDNRRS